MNASHIVYQLFFLTHLSIHDSDTGDISQVGCVWFVCPSSYFHLSRIALSQGSYCGRPDFARGTNDEYKWLSPLVRAAIIGGLVARVSGLNYVPMQWSVIFCACTLHIHCGLLIVRYYSPFRSAPQGRRGRP